MAFAHGKSSYFEVDDSAGTLRDISAYCNDVSFSRPADTAETSTFGDSDKTYLPGLKDATISVSGVWDSTLDGYLSGIDGSGSLNWSYGPEGSGTGKVKYTQTTADNATGGTLICTNYEVSGSVGDAVAWSAEFQISGAPTRTTY